MSLEWPQNKEKQDNNVDISNLSYNFCSDDLINSYYEQKLLEISDKDRWLDGNQENLLKNKDSIAKAVQDGLIADDNLETIWQFQIDKMKDGKDNVIEIKKELEQKIEQIKTNVAKRLSEFLPNWKPDKINVSFIMDDKADFCVDESEITVDLGRLLTVKDFVEKVTEGLTHEVFHIWMKEKNEWSDSKLGNAPDKELKAQIVFGTIDEGLAVLISGQSLQEHHERQGRDYKKYITESFDFFKEFLAQNNSAELEKMEKQGFENMGHCYVVGNEITKTVLGQIGIEKFRKLIQECRTSPERMIDEYEVICKNMPELISVKG